MSSRSRPSESTVSIVRRQRLNTFEWRSFWREIAIGEIVTELQLIEPRRFRESARAQAAEFRGERQLVTVVTKVERFDSETISGQTELMPASVPNGEGEHAVKPPQTLGALLGPQTQHNLHITGGAEAVAACLEVPPQLAKVVNLSIENDGKGPLLIDDRLLSSLEVDHRQPAKTQRHPDVIKEPIVVRTTMGEGAGHLIDTATSFLGVSPAQNPSNAAHQERVPISTVGADVPRKPLNAEAAASRRPRILTRVDFAGPRASPQVCGAPSGCPIAVRAVPDRHIVKCLSAPNAASRAASEYSLAVGGSCRRKTMSAASIANPSRRSPDRS